MGTTRIRIDPDDPSTFPTGRIDPAAVDATTEADIARLNRILAEAGVDARKRLTVTFLRMSRAAYV